MDKPGGTERRVNAPVAHEASQRATLLGGIHNDGPSERVEYHAARTDETPKPTVTWPIEPKLASLVPSSL
jgi:hypothetical protein